MRVIDYSHLICVLLELAAPLGATRFRGLLAIESDQISETGAALHSFLEGALLRTKHASALVLLLFSTLLFLQPQASAQGLLDRKSTRLNSSHGYISYAVFCL